MRELDREHSFKSLDPSDPTTFVEYMSIPTQSASLVCMMSMSKLDLFLHCCCYILEIGIDTIPNVRYLMFWCVKGILA